MERSDPEEHFRYLEWCKTMKMAKLTTVKRLAKIVTILAKIWANMTAFSLVFKAKKTKKQWKTLKKRSFHVQNVSGGA